MSEPSKPKGQLFPYKVTEVVNYHVWAINADAAEKFIEGDARRDRFVVSVEERNANLLQHCDDACFTREEWEKMQ